MFNIYLLFGSLLAVRRPFKGQVSHWAIATASQNKARIQDGLLCKIQDEDSLMDCQGGQEEPEGRPVGPSDLETGPVLLVLLLGC